MLNPWACHIVLDKQHPLQVDMDKSLLDLFMEANYDEFWDESSDLRDALLYCRGSSRICIPHEWRAALPTHL